MTLEDKKHTHIFYLIECNGYYFKSRSNARSTWVKDPEKGNSYATFGLARTSTRNIGPRAINEIKNKISPSFCNLLISRLSNMSLFQRMSIISLSKTI